MSHLQQNQKRAERDQGKTKLEKKKHREFTQHHFAHVLLNSRRSLFERLGCSPKTHFENFVQLRWRIFRNLNSTFIVQWENERAQTPQMLKPNIYARKECYFILLPNEFFFKSACDPNKVCHSPNLVFWRIISFARSLRITNSKSSLIMFWCVFSIFISIHECRLLPRDALTHTGPVSSLFLILQISCLTWMSAPIIKSRSNVCSGSVLKLLWFYCRWNFCWKPYVTSERSVISSNSLVTTNLMCVDATGCNSKVVLIDILWIPFQFWVEWSLALSIAWCNVFIQLKISWILPEQGTELLCCLGASCHQCSPNGHPSHCQEAIWDKKWYQSKVLFELVLAVVSLTFYFFFNKKNAHQLGKPVIGDGICGW